MVKKFIKTKPDIVRLGIEMQYRGYAVWEHSRFGGVKKGAHMPNSKHSRDEAIDLNWNPKVPTSALENRKFDRLALELVRRYFGVIWNRGPGDHQTHLHAETWFRPLQYPGRYRLKGKVSWRKLTVDGAWGPNTNRALQEWLGVAVTGTFTPATAKALQAFLNTELRGTLVIDGKFGVKSVTALQRYLETPQTGKYSAKGSAMVKAMQQQLNKYGSL